MKILEKKGGRRIFRPPLWWISRSSQKPSACLLMVVPDRNVFCSCQAPGRGSWSRQKNNHDCVRHTGTNVAKCLSLHANCPPYFHTCLPFNGNMYARRDRISNTIHNNDGGVPVPVACISMKRTISRITITPLKIPNMENKYLAHLHFFVKKRYIRSPFKIGGGPIFLLLMWCIWTIMNTKNESIAIF